MRTENFSARKLLLTVALVAVAAACSSSSKSAGNATTPSTTTASAAASSTLPATVPGQTVATTPDTKSFSGSSSSSFCELARKDEADFNNNPNIATKTPADLKALYAKLVPALEHAADIAPSAIKSDFRTYVTSIKTIESTLAAAQYNFENLDPTKLAGLNSPALKSAAEHLQQYFTQVCHITTPSSPTTPAS